MSQISAYEIGLFHSQVHRTLRGIVSQHLEQFGVTMMEWLLLGTVKAGPKEGVTMTTVARTLHVTLPQVTALTTVLMQSKLIKQRVSKHDRRNKYLVCSGSAKKLLQDIDKVIDTALQEWMADVSAADKATHLQVMRMLADETPASVA